MSAANHYTAPTADLGDRFSRSAPGGDPVALRTEYLSHEGAVQSIGSLYYFSSAMIGFAAVALALSSFSGEEVSFALPLLAVCGFFGWVFFWMAGAMRRLDPRVRMPVGFVAGLGLLNPPVGTLINGYILYLVFGKKGKVVFSDEYAAAREATPDMAYETSMIVKVAVGALLLVIVGGIGAAVLSN